MAKKPKKRKWRGVVLAMGMGEFRVALETMDNKQLHTVHLKFPEGLIQSERQWLC